MGDMRDTVEKKQDFIPLLRKLMEEKKEASILYDDGGVTRASGLVTAMRESGTDTEFVLNDTLVINVSALFALNGLFSSDYSEC